MMKNNKQENNSDKNMSGDLNSLFSELRLDMLSYIKTRFAYYKLDLIEKSSKIISMLSLGIVMAGILLCSFIFALISLGFYLGNVYNSNALGFGLVSLIWLAVFLIIILLRKPIKNFILNRCISILYNVQKEEDNDDTNE